MTAARRLIVNADDLGRTRGVDAGIARAHAEGVVTSATLSVAYAAAAGLGATCPRVGCRRAHRQESWYYPGF